MDILFDDETPLDQNIHLTMDTGMKHIIDRGEFHLQAGIVYLIKKKNTDPYFNSISNMILTPNDTTIYNQLPKINEFNKHWWVIGSILQCNNQKVNKSSVLWFYFVQLTRTLWNTASIDQLESDSTEFTKMGDLNTSSGIDKRFIIKRIVDVITKAVKTHPRNYYACNSICQFGNLMNGPFLNEIKGKLIELDDLSFWLAWVRSIPSSTEGLTWIRSEMDKGGMISCMSSGKQVLAIYETVTKLI